MQSSLRLLSHVCTIQRSAKSVGTWFGEICSCPCLANRNKYHQTTYQDFSRSRYSQREFLLLTRLHRERCRFIGPIYWSFPRCFRLPSTFQLWMRETHCSKYLLGQTKAETAINMYRACAFQPTIRHSISIGASFQIGGSGGTGKTTKRRDAYETRNFLLAASRRSD